MPSRRSVAGVLVAAGLGGLCFAPVFGVPALAGPVLAVCVAGFLVVEGTRRWAALVAWRPVLFLVFGLLAVVETMLFSTTLAGVPTASTGRALASGVRSWQRTLESTWPARPEPELALFVPLLVLLAGLLGVELLYRFGGLAAMLPSLGVVGLSQAYQPASGWPAYLLAVVYALTAAVVLVPARVARGAGVRRTRSRDWMPLLGAVGLTVAGLLGGLLVAGLAPGGSDPYTLRRAQAEQVPTPRVNSPLDEVTARLSDPEATAFRYRASSSSGAGTGTVGGGSTGAAADGARVDRWRLVALDDFDGTNWTTDSPFLRFGAELRPGQSLRVPTSPSGAEVDVRSLPGPWLPSQSLPRAVGEGGEVYVEPGSGTLFATDRPDRYTLAWSTPQVTGEALLAAAVDRSVPVGDVGNPPPEIVALASSAVSGKRATVQTALALERFLASRCSLVSAGKQLPAGHGWPQLKRFLLEDKRGTSEQFAAAYVALARLNGIPARLVVGFRTPAVADLDGWLTVRNKDVLAWPEIAVDGIGWWPLDPAGLADPARPRNDSRDAVTAKARAELPPPDQLDDPAVPKEDSAPEASGGPVLPSVPVGALAWLLLVPAAWVTGAPFARFVRARLRRRRGGAAAVTGAWVEARDRLRAHGVPVTSGMTVRDLATAATPIIGPGAGTRTQAGLSRLALAVDAALWSPADPSDQVVSQAWTGVGEVVQGLRARPWRSRLRAALDPRSLLGGWQQ
ncbi:transglutaminase TgpA family protein [Flindersiella endophytica]